MLLPGDTPLVEPTLAKVIVVLCLDGFPPAPNCGVDILLECSLIVCYLPLPAGGEVAGVELWEWMKELKQSCVHVADCDSIDFR